MLESKESILQELLQELSRNSTLSAPGLGLDLLLTAAVALGVRD